MILEEQFPVPRNNSVRKIGNSVISLLWQLRCHCNPDHNKFSSLSNTTVVAIFPKLCLWRRGLCSNLGGIGPEKLYRATLKTIVFLKIKIKYYVRILVLWITWAPSLLTVKSSLFDYHTSLSACYIRIQENRTLLMQARRESDRASYMCVLFLCSVIGWFWHDMGQHSLTIWISLHVLEHLCFPTSDFHFQFYVSVC